MTEKENPIHSIKISSRVTIPGNIFLAPMAGFTDAAFRHICRENGSDLCYTEMVSCEALVRDSRKTKAMAERAENEDIYAVQLFCASPETARRALAEILPLNPVLIDLNCGCPVPKIIKSGAGAALMREPEKIGEIVKALAEETEIPVTVKLRSGWDSGSITFLKAAEAAARGGAAMVALHPRTKTQGYSGTADREKIKQLKKETDIPVIGSGDIFTPESALEMIASTGCDGVMVARGAVGRPEIFREIRHLASTGKLPEISFNDKIKNALAHLELAVRYRGEAIAVKEMKKHLCAYIKGVKGSAAIRNTIVHCTETEEYRNILNNLVNTTA